MRTVPVAARLPPLIADVAPILRRAAIRSVACAVAAAVAGGVGSRVAMRVSALAAPEMRGTLTENGNVVGDITLAGTLGLFVFVSLAAAVVGVGAAAILGPWLPRRTSLRGPVLGSALLLLLGSLIIDPANPDFVVLGDPLLSVAMFSALFLLFGIVVAVTGPWLEERVPEVRPSSPRSIGLAALCSLPVLPGVAAVTVGVSLERGSLLLGAWLGMTAASVVARRGGRRTAVGLCALATGLLLTGFAAAAAAYVDAVATIV